MIETDNICTKKWIEELISPASWLFTQPFIQAQINENIKTPRYKWPIMRKTFPFDDVIMIFMSAFRTMFVIPKQLQI